jgi:hypothetical protein
MNSQGMKKLIAHVIAQAYEDLYKQQTRQEARDFFLSADCNTYCQILGYNPGEIRGIAYGQVRA